VKQLRAFGYAVGRALILFVLAIWFIASCAGAYAALFVFWPFLSVVFVVVWAVCRLLGLTHPDTAAVTVERRTARLRRLTFGASDRPPHRRVLAAVKPSFSVEIAQPRWLEVAHGILWAPFFLQGPLLIGMSLLQVAAQEEPRIVVEWSWLPIGAMLIAGFAATAVAFASYAARHFVAPATIGRRIQIPLTDYALCAAHRDVSAVEIQRGTELIDRNSFYRIRFLRSGGEPWDLTLGITNSPDAPPPDELVALAKVLAHAARVPLRAPAGSDGGIGYAGEYDVGLSPHDEATSRK